MFFLTLKRKKFKNKLNEDIIAMGRMNLKHKIFEMEKNEAKWNEVNIILKNKKFSKKNYVFLKELPLYCWNF